MDFFTLPFLVTAAYLALIAVLIPAAIRDMRHRIVPRTYWRWYLIPAALGVINWALYNGSWMPLILCGVSVLVLHLLASRRILNGADAVSLMAVVIAMPPMLLGYVPLGVLTALMAFFIGMAITFAASSWKAADSIPFIFPILMTVIVMLPWYLSVMG